MTNRLRNEDGSLLLTLMMSIAIGGMIVALFALVTQSQRTTRRDRAWTASIQVADAGLQQAYSYLSTTDPGINAIDSSAAAGDADYAAAFSNSTSNGAFTWTATKTADEEWLVRSIGEVDGVVRVVEAVLSKGTVGGFAMFSKDDVTLAGSNEVRSYSHATGLTPCPNVGPPPAAGCSNKGFVGTNGDLTLNGNATIDRAFIFGGGACSGCTDPSRFPDEFDVDGYALAIEAQANIDCPSGGTTSMSTVGPAFTAGDIYCLTALDFAAPMYVDGNSAADPAIVYVFGNVTTSANGQNKKFNCFQPPQAPTYSGCDALQAGDPVDVTQDPGGLRIKVIGPRTVQLANQGVYTMTIDAPESQCPKPGGQVSIYGYIICDGLGTNGGYDVAYDEGLNATGVGDYRITGYREERMNSTSN